MPQEGLLRAIHEGVKQGSLMHIPIDSPDIRSAYVMDRSGKSGRRFKKDRNPRIERIKDKVIYHFRQKAERQKVNCG